MPTARSPPAPSPTGPTESSLLEFLDPESPDPLRGPDVRRLLRITCVAALHRHRPLVLAEVWQTSQGLLYIVKLLGRLLDPGEQASENPFEPPAAVRNWTHRTAVAAPQANTGDQWTHIPVTIIRLLLEDDVPAELWTMCPDHKPVKVDRGRLYRE